MIDHQVRKDASKMEEHELARVTREMAAAVEPDAGAAQESVSEPAEEEASQAPEAEPAPVREWKFKCNSCLAGWDEAAEHRKHFRSDWHRVNLKRRVEGLEAVSEEQAQVVIKQMNAKKNDDPFA